MLVGTSTADDAGVYKLTDDIALIQTIDVFTPVVDDPYMYGRIVAANSISDVYAMGGAPLTALNFIGFPQKVLSTDDLVAILTGGHDKCAEAGVTILGGHTIIDQELKYGLSVTGVVHPDKILRNCTARPGDVLFLTKPIGTGILSTALKQDKADVSVEERISAIMEELNKVPSELMQEYGASSCTDVTGYGLLGHAFEMANGSSVSLTISYSAVPQIPGTLEHCKKGAIPGGTWNNKKFLENNVSFSCDLSEEEQLILFDAQTSGGLLIAIPAANADGFEESLHESGIASAARIGEVSDGISGNIEIIA